MTAKLVEKFQELFGAEGDIRTYFAPGRVNLEHMGLQGREKIISFGFTQ